ncbi:hypothetical protein [Paenibacillus selenitireducens]|uniref:hypothetical protein n=1 Tax=Paenibacillus selenitireducens TaxID=1324314 RepID=UPI00117D383D|nr:hypothetical protein [Paenibacillus selenitireducens]
MTIIQGITNRIADVITPTMVLARRNLMIAARRNIMSTPMIIIIRVITNRIANVIITTTTITA